MRDQVFRDLMAAVCAPVTVVTTMEVTSAGEAVPHGATVSAFASLSLRPPLVTVALDRRSALLARVLAAGRPGVNVLASGDDDIDLRFAQAASGERFAGVAWTPAHGLPRLDGAAAWSGERPHRPVAVFRHQAVAAAKPSGNPPSLPLVPVRGRSRGSSHLGDPLVPGCHTCPSPHPRAINVRHQCNTRT